MNETSVRAGLRAPNGRGLGALLAVSVAALLAACGGGTTPEPVAEEVVDAAAFGTQLPRAAVEPLGVVGVPDVNELGLLDRTGPNAGSWPQVTNAGKKELLRVLGKSLFWDMQVGGDGIQACASCHFHAGADNRVVAQVSPGGGGTGDAVRDLSLGSAGALTAAHFSQSANGLPNRGLAVSEAALLQRGATPDLVDGTPGQVAKTTDPTLDLNDVVSSQGVRAATSNGVRASRVDAATLAQNDNANGFTHAYTSPAPGMPNTLRRVPGRNSPTVLNSVYNLRNFWDGRANMYFNGRNPLGVNDPDARVKVHVGGNLTEQQLLLPFSSLASQAVGPIGSDFEMTPSGRALADLGRKLTLPGVMPLGGQAVASDDSQLAGFRHSSGRGLNRTYESLIREVFDRRFWGDAQGRQVCVNAAGGPPDAGSPTVADANGQCPQYTLMQWNFPLFFGLAVQAYEARLTTGQTIVDLIAGGMATGTVRVTNGKKIVQMDVTGVALDGCIAGLASGGSAAVVDAATAACTAHYAKFIHPAAVTGSESATATNPVPANTAIGGCANPSTCSASPNLAAARATLLNVNDGLGRFFAGATGCAVCHFNPEFTGATVSTVTRFGAKLPVLPNGQLRRELEARAVLERMPLFSGDIAVYDVGFYNIGVRPTAEDIAVGSQINGVPIALGKMLDVAAGGSAAGLNGTMTQQAVSLIRTAPIPTAPDNLTPTAFPLVVGCAPGLVGGGNANNNPNTQCNPNVVAGERLQRNGSFKVPGLRNVRFTGPYMHNGSKMTLRQVLEFYKTAGHFNQINLNNMDAGIRVFSLGAAEESALVEMMETGLTDWRVAVKSAPFDHPELCVPNGQDQTTGSTRLAGLPAVGRTGGQQIATFDEMVRGAAGNRANNMRAACGVVGINVGDTTPIAQGDLAKLVIDVPPQFP